MPNRMQNILNRLYDSAYTGWQSAVSAYRQEYFVAEEDTNWDSYAARMARYYYNRRYVDNTLYSSVNRYAAFFKQTEGLYKYLRGLRNPVSRLVKMEKAKVWGGFVNYETFKDGALVINGADDILLEGIRTIWQWTDIQPFKNLLVQEGGSMGDIAIKVIDDTSKGKVYLEVLDPRKVKEVAFDSRGNVKEVYIAYEDYDRLTKSWYEYGEIITPESFATFKDGEPFSYIEGLAEEWDNPYGFVPIEWIKHSDVGKKFGATSFQDTRSKIDNLNDLTTLLHDNIRRTVNTKYAVSKVSIPRDTNGNPVSLGISTDSRDTSPLLEVGEGGAITPIAFPIDIAGALQAIDAQMKEVEADMPILALQSIRNMGGSMSGVSIENLYSDGVDSVETLQGTYYQALISATQMALTIAGHRRYDKFRAFNLDSYENGSLDFIIRPKKVFQDSLSTKENVELSLLAVESSAYRLLLEKLGYSNDEIDALEELKAQKERTATRASLREQALNLRAENAANRLAETNSTPSNGGTLGTVLNSEEDIENPPAQ